MPWLPSRSRHLGFTCPRCHDSFLFQPQECPTCASLNARKQRGTRARERRANYDPVGKIAETEFWQLLRLYPCCPCCGASWEHSEGAIARDHVIPISRGGPNTSVNLQPLCQTCNLWKSDRLMYFNRAMPGRIAPLPAILWPAFKAISDYSPTPNQARQLSLMPTPTDVAFPSASPEELQIATIERTWQAIQSTEQSNRAK